MEPYREDKPFISIDTETSLLDRLLQAGIPFTRALKYYRDNPEGSALETLKLAAEDVIPFYGTYRNDGDISDYAKEAVMLGVPMPYIKHPKTGAQIPNNLKEALGTKGWSAVKYGWSHDKPTARKLYTEETLPNKSVPRTGLSTRARVGSTANAREAIEIPAGPYRETNTGSNFINHGQQAVNTNTISSSHAAGTLSGAHGWQGEMYPPGRSLARLDEAGPYIWDAVPDQREYIRKLNDIINENEYKWEYLINKTRTRPSEGSRNINSTSVVPKEDIVSIALSQGRPDIAARVMSDNSPRVGIRQDPRFLSYAAKQSPAKGIPDNAKWKDHGNRLLEKELRETFAMLPEDDLLREKFADYYGVPDLYNDWIANPEYWKEFRNKTAKNRIGRERSNRSLDKRYGRTIQR
jgi:hypothetical protein